MSVNELDLSTPSDEQFDEAMHSTLEELAGVNALLAVSKSSNLNCASSNRSSFSAVSTSYPSIRPTT